MFFVKRVAIIISVLMCVFMTSCSKTPNKYDIGTDFGGDIAIVGKYIGESELGKLTGSSDPQYEYFAINRTGKQLFSLPKSLLPAYDEFAITKMAPVNNYIFATDIDDEFSCKYILDKNGNIMLSPEKNDYEAVFVPQNYREMFCDGYVLVYKNSFTYEISEQLLSCFDLQGNQLFKFQKLFNDDITERFVKPYYVGDGILSLGDECLNLKTGAIVTGFDIESSIYNSENYDFTLQDSEINRKAAHESIDEDCGGVYTVYNGYFGIGFYNWDSNKDYISVAKVGEELLFEPFPTDKFEKVCVHDKGFIIVPKTTAKTTECDILFYDLAGNYARTVSLSLPEGTLNVSDFSCGYFKIEKGDALINYIDSDGNFLF